MTKIGIKGAFLQSGKAERDVYVGSPRECVRKYFYWLLDVATYGLVNANAKWQCNSDNTFSDTGLKSVVHIPQLFYLRLNGNLALVVAKVTDDILVGGSLHNRKTFIQKLSKSYVLGTVVHMPGTFQFFGLQLEQQDNDEIQLSGEEKLQNISPYTIPRARRKDPDSSLTSVQLFHFQSVNDSLGFLGMCISPVSCFAASYLQQTDGPIRISNMVKQISLLKTVQSLGSYSSYKCPPTGKYPLSILVFTDAGKPSTRAQRRIIGGLLIGDHKEGSVFHTLQWNSHLSHRPVKSIASSEVLAAGEGVDEGKQLARTYKKLLQLDVPLTVLVDSKDLFTSISTCRVPEDKSIRADLELLRYYYETKQLNELIWIPGSTNLSDSLTKKDSPLCNVLQLMLFDGFIPMNIDKAQSSASKTSMG